MTNKPELKSDLDLTSGIAAAALFVVMAAVFLGAQFGEPAGFPETASVVASLGYAMFNITGNFVPIEGEGMLAAFEIIDIVLVAALVGSIMLARRDDGLPKVSEIRSDGGDDADVSLLGQLKDAFGGEK